MKALLFTPEFFITRRACLAISSGFGGVRRGWGGAEVAAGGGWGARGGSKCEKQKRKGPRETR